MTDEIRKELLLNTLHEAYLELTHEGATRDYNVGRAQGLATAAYFMGYMDAEMFSRYCSDIRKRGWGRDVGDS